MKTQPKAPKKKSNWVFPLILVAAVSISVWYLSGKHDDSNTNAKELDPINATAAQKLASMDALSITRLPADDSRVLKTDALLNGLSASYNEAPEQIANATYVAHEQLRRSGKSMTNIAILEHMATVTPKGIRYKQAVMAYIADVAK